jgi:GNAT superfamily N-acetyltransferase
VSDLLRAFSFRPAGPGERGYICDTFRRHLEWDETAAEFLRGSISDHVIELDRLLRDPRARTVIASLENYPDQVFGWACAIDGALWFAYVGKEYRRWGLGSQLAIELGIAPPFPLVYWTHHAEKIHRERAYPIAWDWRALRAVNRRCIAQHRQIKGAA